MKLPFEMPDEDLDALRKLAGEKNVLLTKALCRAIEDSRFLTETRRGEHPNDGEEGSE